MCICVQYPSKVDFISSIHLVKYSAVDPSDQESGQPHRDRVDYLLHPVICRNVALISAKDIHSTENLICYSGDSEGHRD